MPQDEPPGARFPYLPALDGLRGLAALSVLFYHADMRWMPGGFLGVDLFFVLSGYLITALLLHEWDQHGTIALGAFWKRRLYRLYPAMAVLIVSVLLVVLLWLPDQAASIPGDALAAAGYMSNWHLVLSKRPYFEAMGRPPLLRHLWSLAVEAQFYLLWPLILVLLKPTRSRKWVLFAALAGAVLSTTWMATLYHPDYDPSRVYYGTDTRLAGPLIGAALACIYRPRPRREPKRRLQTWLMDGLALSAVGLLIAACAGVNEFQPLLYRGGFALISLLTAAAMAAALHPDARLAPRLLSAPALRWLGTRSLSIYLWHWPVFMVTRPHLDLALDGLPLLLLRLGLTALLAEGSYRLIERPVRYQPATWAKGTRQAVLWAAPLAILMAVGVTLRPAFATHIVSTPHPTAVVQQATATRCATATPTAPPTLTRMVMTRPPTETPLVQTIPDQVTPTSIPQASPTPTLTPTPTPISTPPCILALGDSVMLDARRDMKAMIAGIEIDAAVGRQAYEMLRILRERKQAGQLGDMVIIHLGSNGIFRPQQFDEIMAVLGDAPKVIFVNVRVPRRWQDPINTMLEERVQRYGNVVLADWYAASQDCTDCFIQDGVHLNETGSGLYTECLIASVDQPVKDAVYDPLQ